MKFPSVKKEKHSCLPQVFLAIFVVGWVWSLFGPSDWLTWFLETCSFLIALPVIIGMHRKFPLTNITLLVLLLSGLMMCVGAYYTYAQVPLGFWLQDVFGFERNHFDRIGHFFQGVAPAMLFREVLLRHTDLKPGMGWLFFIVTCISLALSAGYELLEWAAVLIYGNGTQEFLGMQGDIWDAQADMLMALMGAVSTLVLFRKEQTRQFKLMQRWKRSHWVRLMKDRKKFMGGFLERFRH